MMDVRHIKEQANQIYIHNRKQIIPEFFYVGYIGLLAQYLHSGLFSFFVSLFLSPIAHGYVVSSIELVEKENPHLDYHKSMVGIIDFARVAPAYLARKAVILLATFIAGLPLVLSIYDVLPKLSLEWISSLGNAFIQTEFFIPDITSLILVLGNSLILLNLCLCLFVYLALTAILSPVPYVMELEDFSWSESFRYSFQLIKHQLWNYFKLYFAFFVRHGIYWFVTGIVIMIVAPIHEILMLLCLVTSLFFYIEVFKGRYEIAKYLFYKEIRGDFDEKYQED